MGTKTKSEFIRFAWEFDGKGGGQELTGSAITKQLKAKKLAWVHLDAANPLTREWLRKELAYLDEWILDALLANETRPRITEVNEGMLVILREMNFNEGADIEDMVAVRGWFDNHRIITMSRRPILIIQHLYEELKSGQGVTDAGGFVTQLSQRIAEMMQPVLTEIDDTVDEAEEQVMLNPSKEQRQEVVDIRRQIIMFRRYILPQRDVMQTMRATKLSFMDNEDLRRASETYNRLTRYVEDLDTLRERAQIVKDELSTTLSDQLNHNLYVLSVVAAIFLPLGFLTGLMGINIGGMPGVDDERAFWIFCVSLVIITGLQVWIFKKLKWF